MTYRIVKNTRQKTLMLLTASNSDIVVVGNSSVSEIGLPAATDEDITGVSITQVWSSADSGAGANGWDIIRNANTIWQTDSTSWLDFAGLGASLTVDSTEANITFSRTGSRGTLLVELQKEYAGSWKYDGHDY